MQVVHGNPYQQKILPTGDAPRGPGSHHGKPTTSPTSPPVVDQVDLSPEAQDIVNNGPYTAPGNSAHSMAHRVRAMMAEGNALVEGLSFSEAVSGLASGRLDLTPPAPVDTTDTGDVPPVEDTGEVVAPTDEGEVTEPSADPVDIVVEDPVIEEDIVEESAAEETSAPVDEAPVETLPETELVEVIDPDSEIVEILEAADEEAATDETV